LDFFRHQSLGFFDGVVKEVWQNFFQSHRGNLLLHHFSRQLIKNRFFSDADKVATASFGKTI